MDDLLTRRLAFEQNMDPMGRKWGIGKVLGTALFCVDVLDGPPVGSKPKSLSGKFTNPNLAQKAIEGFLTELWDKNDSVQAKANKKAQRSTAD